MLELKKEKKAAHTQLFGNKNEENSLSRKSAGQQNQVPWGKRVTWQVLENFSLFLEAKRLSFTISCICKYNCLNINWFSQLNGSD